MKIFNRLSLIALITVLVTACNPAPTPIPPVLGGNNPYAPQPGDSNMIRGEVRINTTSLVLAQSQPPQEIVNFDYFQPTICHKLRVEVSQPDAQNNIKLNAYAMTEKDKACAMIAVSTPLKASLNFGSYPKGHYIVWANNIKVGEFDS